MFGSKTTTSAQPTPGHDQYDAPPDDPDKKKLARLRKGYIAPPEVRRAVRENATPNALIFIACGVIDWATILLAAAAGIAAFKLLPFWMAALILLGVWTVVTVTLRSVEALVHWGSHRDAHANPTINDSISNIVAAVPTGTTVQAFRASHDRHHQHYGSADDPDRRRLANIRADEINRSSFLAYVRGMAQRLPRYSAEWFKEIGKSESAARRVRAFAAWHVTVFVLPGTIVLSVMAADATTPMFAAWLSALSWSLFWWVVTVVVPFIVFLPILRFINEVAEHVYDDNGNEFDSTVSNIGLLHRLVLHRHGDAFHGIHHAFPELPFWMQGKLHRLLLRLDPTGYGQRLLVRFRVLQQPFQIGTVYKRLTERSTHPGRHVRTIAH